MSRLPIISRLSCTAGVLLVAALPVAAQTPDTTATKEPARPVTSGILVKLGTGFSPNTGFELGGYSGLSVPLVLGVERHLTPRVSLFANGFSGLRMGPRYRYYGGPRETIFGNYGFDAGVRYYYNQEKRRQHNRATGPFVGNYLALQTSSTFDPNYYHKYRRSVLTIAWGMQRRIGKYGWFDAYAGVGIGREPLYIYDNVLNTTRTSSYYGLAPEIGIKFSLGSHLR